MDLIAGATGDTPHMGAFRRLVNSQAEPGPDTGSHALHGFIVENADVVNTLPTVPPRKK